MIRLFSAKRFFPIYLFVQMIFVISKSSFAFDSTLTSKLQFTIDSIRTSQNFKGVSASVIIPGHGLWQGVSGVSHSGVNITPGMYLGIGSNTKTFMSALALKLAEMNVIKLEDSLYKWIPRFVFVDSTITIRQLLNHTSGIFSISEKPGYADSILANPNRHWTPEEILNTFLSTPYFPKGQSFRYSNTNYIILGMIIKSAAGEQVSAKLNELILDPLGLDDTFLAVEEIVQDTIAHPWANGIDINATPRTSLLSAAWTAGAMYSNSENTSRWYQNLFGGQLLAQSSMSQMLNFTPQSGFVYGLGVTRYVINGRVLFGHSGDIRGYTSCMLFDTTLNMSITVLVNQLGVNPVAIAVALLNTVLRNPLPQIGVDLTLSAIIEGFYDNSYEKMRMSDTATVFIRNSFFPYTIVDSSTAILDSSTFSGLFRLQKVTSGNYYITLKHRNSIETWSKLPVNLTAGSADQYEFVSNQSTAYGNNLALADNSPLRYSIYSGDVNGDAIVDAFDLSEIDNDAFIFAQGYFLTDITGDNLVDASDGSIADNNAANFVSVIRP
ncbi:MAG: beta-lactamase family protein [Ignavibacteria bacterium]|nr:beta-lactamase family protein [Ignavibacteria bacterium]